MCSCGCNTCETKITGPLLTEGKIKSLLSEGLQYHIDKKIPLFETVYRIGSEKHLSLIREARKMYSRGIIDLCEDDEHLIKTHLGEFGLYEGESVPLDLPMLENNRYESIIEDIKVYSKVYESVNIENSYPIKDIESDSLSISFIFTDKHGIQRKLQMFEDNSVKVLWFNPITKEFTTQDIPRKYEDDKVMNTFGKILIKSILPEYNSFNLTALNFARYRLFRALIFNNLDKSQYAMDFDDATMEIEVYPILNEAEFKGKDVSLNKPKRGGSKAYYVYVRDPKTKRVKKVSFGSGGLRAKIKNKVARNAFAKRHRCSEKKDRTSPGYWACNTPRYAKLLGLGDNINTFW
jgi:hypothetical protein